MNRREKIQLKQVEQLEAEFRELLISCLEECVRGQWGLFGTFDYLGAERRYWNWPQADQLRELATSIQSTRAQSGEQNALCAEFLDLCATHKANDPGEPKRAQAFLKVINSSDAETKVGAAPPEI